MEYLSIKYCIEPENGSKKEFDLRFNAENLDLIFDTPEHLPQWTELGFHQCSNCTLKNPPHERCPLAVHLSTIITYVGGITSYDSVTLTVVTQERTIFQETTAQRAISSLIGLVSAASGCPHTVYFKPMARFHLPLANEGETIYRATSMYLLAQYFLKQGGMEPDIDLIRLKEIYNNILIVNSSIAGRLRAASKTDLTVNAIIILDVYAKAIPSFVEDLLEEIRPLFNPFFS